MQSHRYYAASHSGDDTQEGQKTSYRGNQADKIRRFFELALSKTIKNSFFVFSKLLQTANQKHGFSFLFFYKFFYNFFYKTS